MHVIDLFPSILPREEDSVFRDYVEANQQELDVQAAQLELIERSRQVDQASSEDLDRIGKLFGEVGRRRGRSDDVYRSYLKAVIQAFAGRGIDYSMRNALSAAFLIDIDDIEIVEDTTDSSYEIVLYDWTDHSLENLNRIAQIVDPSGVNQTTTRYKIEDTSTSSDIVELPETNSGGPEIQNSSDIVATDVNLVNWDENNWDNELVWA